jgi:large subunit ribosomal protein L25
MRFVQRLEGVISGDFMASRAQLKADKRELFGKKVRRLRRAGILPATVYGNKIEPQSIQVDSHAVRDVMRQAGSTQLIDLVIESQPARPVLIRQTTVDAKRNAVIHIEFFQANLREKMTTHVPLHFVGESPAVKDGGIFLTVLNHIDIESLPQDVPEAIEVDVSVIVEMNGVIHAGELSLPAGLELVMSADEVVAKVNPPVAEEVEEAAAEAEAPVELGGEEASADAVPEA